MVPARRSILSNSSHEIISFILSLLFRSKVMQLLQIQIQMKLKFSFVVLLIGCFAGFVTQAQDESQPAQEVQEFNQQHPDLNLGEDKTLLMDTDIRRRSQHPPPV